MKSCQKLFIGPKASHVPRAALLIHGFTATPECLESLKGPLERAGFDVEAPRLAGHGTSARDLRRTTWLHWYRGVLEAYEALAKRSDSVCVAGQSLGGLLALKLASERRVRRLALLATPVLFEGFLLNRLLPVIAGSPLRHLYAYQPKLLGAAISDPYGRKVFQSYFWMPVESVMEIMRLQENVRRRLESVTAPTLIVHSPHDTTAPYASMAYLEERLGSKTVQTVTLEKSNHVLTLDYEKDLVAREVVKFFRG
jgi:carboxylesterase